VSYGDLRFALCESGLRVEAAKPFILENRIGIDGDNLPNVLNCEAQRLSLSYKGIPYALHLTKGNFLSPSSICSENNTIEFSFSNLL
jgi:hypothetical protein